MKLLNQSLLYLSIPIFFIVSIWAIVFYFNMLEEIYDSLDDGLENSKLLIVHKTQQDTSILHHNATFDESNYAIREIPRPKKRKIKDIYTDTLMYMFNEHDLEPVRMLTTAFEHNNQYYELKVISSMVEEDDQIDNLLWSTIWLYLILLSIIIIVNNLVLRKVWNPFYNLLNYLKNFRIEKDTTIPSIKTKTREFNELKKACDILIGHTVESYNNQKQFTENAAHELQTPIAIITNKLELLLEEKRLHEKDAEIIEQVLQTATQLKQLNKSLLLLSKIENKQFFDNQNISLNNLAHDVVEDLEEFIQFKNIDLTIHEPEQISIVMDAHLAHILVSNLIKNAIFHNYENGKIKVGIEQNALAVSNTSNSGELDERKIFKRFYQNGEKQKGTGLGLPIVHAICKLYGFSMLYLYTHTNEHRFLIKFK